MKIIWNIYKFFSLVFFTLFLIFLAFLYSLYLSSYIQLPNGIVIKQSKFHDDCNLYIKGLNESKKFRVCSEYVHFLGDYIFGYYDNTETKKEAYIYKASWKKPIIYKSLKAYRADLSKYGLNHSIDIPTSIFEEDSYAKCLKYYGKTKCKFKAYDNYWLNINLKNAELYSCSKDNEEICTSYSISKNYLSLEDMGFRRNWPSNIFKWTFLLI